MKRRYRTDIHGPTRREREMLALEETGLGADAIAARMGLNPDTVYRTLHALSMNDTARDHAFFSMIVDGTRALRRAVLDAGGHAWLRPASSDPSATVWRRAKAGFAIIAGAR